MKRFFIFLFLLAISGTLFPQAGSPIIIKTNERRFPVQPTMYGIFFEDINFAADGGIYAELVKNRSFEFTEPLMGWKVEKNNNEAGSVLILNRGYGYDGNPRVARIKVNHADDHLSLTNEGFRGMGIRKNGRYNFSLLARMQEGQKEDLLIEIINEQGSVVAREKITVSSGEWKKYTVSLVAGETVAKARLRVVFSGTAVTDVDMISLFPEDTWKGRPGGLRRDLVQLLADLKPGFIRFPGGCIVEGRDLSNRYQWKKTVGAVDHREGIINRWNTEFKSHLTPDYFQSFGLGFYEYFLLADDLGAEPLPILNCGMACQFNTAEVVPADELEPYIQDALDLIEFANGSVDTRWGKLRAEMGHPASFHLKMMGVGNEQWGPQYVERYKLFAKAIHEKYPDMKLVSSVGPYAGGELFNYLSPVMKELKADMVDEHYYMPPQFFRDNARRYDSYDRSGPKIFAGEYAAHVPGTEGQGKSTWQAALSEAAFMTGLERNADMVHMTSYAPLLAHADAWQWAPDLIWFNSLECYGTPEYYVQKLFSTNRGTDVVTILKNNEVIAGQDSLYATAAVDTKSGELIIKMVNTSSVEKKEQIQLTGIKKTGSDLSVTELHAPALDARNSFTSPENLAPAGSVIKMKGKRITVVLEPYSFKVLRVKVF